MAELTVSRPIRPVSPHEIAQPHLDDIRGAVSPNTLRAYGSDFRAWERWCRTQDRAPFPASEESVADYLRELAGSASASTVGRRLAAIAWAHKAKGVRLDTKAPVIAFALARIRREHGAASHGKAPITTAEIKAMMVKLPDTTAGLRDRAVILVGYAGALRRSEIAGLDADDVEVEPKGMVVTIRRSKGDQMGRGQVVGIAFGRRAATCPVRALQAWTRSAGIGSGPLFRQMRGSVVLRDRLSDRAVYEIVKRACAGAGLDPARFGAHSLRSGHITQALAGGADPIKAREQARHKSLDTTLIYDRRARSLRDSTSGKLGL